MTTDKICKKCQSSISGDDFRMVADWPFCTCCFEELMAAKKVEKEKTIRPSFAAEEILAATSSKQEVDNEEKPESASSCQMCGCNLPAPAGKFLGVWQLCQKCEDGLAFKLQPVVVEEEEEVEEEPDDRRRDLNGRALQAAPEETQCCSCQRPIFARAGKVVDDQVYCPECFYKKKDQEKNEKIDTAASSCSSCGSDLPAKDLAAIEGFSICKPCLASGPDLALDLAKKRRQKTLEQMRDKLSE